MGSVQGSLWGVGAGICPLPINRRTDTCKNFTLHLTSFAVGKNCEIIPQSHLYGCAIFYFDD